MKLLLMYLSSFADWEVLKLIHENLATYNFMLFLEDLAFQYYEVTNQGLPVASALLRS